MNSAIHEKIAKHALFYVTRDIERAMGFPLHTPGYFIISNDTPFGKTLRDRHPDHIFLVSGGRLLDTWELLEHSDIQSYITYHASHIKPGDYRPNIVVFKNTSHIEAACEKQGWRLLNPPAKLSGMIEDKITQTEWMGNGLEALLPSHRLALCKELVWENTPFVLQFNRAHTGKGTILVTSEKILRDIARVFPDRPARVTGYVPGPTFTNNNIVADDALLVGPVNYQITGMHPFTDTPFATVGNDWTLPARLLTEPQRASYRNIVEVAGEKMRKSGWRGLFGIDVVAEQATGRLFLIEINARQPASAAFESMLQAKNSGGAQHGGITTVEAHLAALLGIPLGGRSLLPVADGAQVIVRNKELRIKNYELEKQKISMLEKNGLIVIPYENTTPGSDLLRIQSGRGIMSDHNEWNEIGDKIATIVGTTSTEEI